MFVKPVIEHGASPLSKAVSRITKLSRLKVPIGTTPTGPEGHPLVPIEMHEQHHDDDEEGNDDDAKKLWAFDEVVEQDKDEIFDTYMKEQLVGRLLESAVFRLCILAVIVVNSVTVGIQTDEKMVATLGLIWDTFDNIFLTIFVLEILLKWYYSFLSFWVVGWNVFDFIIVAVSILGSGASFVSSGRVLRILRVLRAFRSLRSISALQGLQVIVQTILVSLPDMANILILLGIVSFIFAVIGIQIFGGAMKGDFDNLGNAMFSLFIAVTQDGWVNVFRRMEAKGYFVSGAIYFMIFMIIGAFIFGNLISSVVVTNIQASFHEMRLRRKARSRSLVEGGKKAKRNPLAAAAGIGGAGGGAGKTAGGGGGGGGGGGTNGADGVEPIVQPYTYPDMKSFAAGLAKTGQVAMEPNPHLYSNHISLAKYENYLLVLYAIENNLRERMDLKDKLEFIMRDVKDVNEVAFDNESEDSAFGEFDSDEAHLVALRRRKLKQEADEGYEEYSTEEDVIEFPPGTQLPGMEQPAGRPIVRKRRVVKRRKVRVAKQQQPQSSIDETSSSDSGDGSRPEHRDILTRLIQREAELRNKAQQDQKKLHMRKELKQEQQEERKSKFERAQLWALSNKQDETEEDDLESGSAIPAPGQQSKRGSVSTSGPSKTPLPALPRLMVDIDEHIYSIRDERSNPNASSRGMSPQPGARAISAADSRVSIDEDTSDTSRDDMASGIVISRPVDMHRTPQSSAMRRRSILKSASSQSSTTRDVSFRGLAPSSGRRNSRASIQAHSRRPGSSTAHLLSEIGDEEVWTHSDDKKTT